MGIGLLGFAAREILRSLLGEAAAFEDAEGVAPGVHEVPDVVG
jgi:hypothetical protein